MPKTATSPHSGPIKQGVIKTTIPLSRGQWSSQTEDLPGYIVYTSAVAKLSQHCLDSICDVWVTSCLEKEAHGFLLLCSVVCQPAGIRGRGRKSRAGSITSVTLGLTGSLSLGKVLPCPWCPRLLQVDWQQRTQSNTYESHSKASIMKNHWLLPTLAWVLTP